jgi:hypothetical protein
VVVETNSCGKVGPIGEEDTDGDLAWTGMIPQALAEEIDELKGFVLGAAALESETLQEISPSQRHDCITLA